MDRVAHPAGTILDCSRLLFCPPVCWFVTHSHANVFNGTTNQEENSYFHTFDKLLMAGVSVQYIFCELYNEMTVPELTLSFFTYYSVYIVVILPSLS